MSLIHWHKSVLSFHLKEIIEDGQGGHPLALVGLSAINLASRSQRWRRGKVIVSKQSKLIPS